MAWYEILDKLVLVFIILAYVIVSYIGTKVVLRSGELPANDELFNFPEAPRPQLTPAQRAALNGEHVRRSASPASVISASGRVLNPSL